MWRGVSAGIQLLVRTYSLASARVMSSAPAYPLERRKRQLRGLTRPLSKRTSHRRQVRLDCHVASALHAAFTSERRARFADLKSRGGRVARQQQRRTLRRSTGSAPRVSREVARHLEERREVIEALRREHLFRLRRLRFP